MLENEKELVYEALKTYTHRTGKQLRELTGLGSGRLYLALIMLACERAVTEVGENNFYPRRRRYKLAEPQQG